MSFDTSGIFTRLKIWVDEAAAGKKIFASDHDTHDGDLANGLSMMICKDGRSAVQADIPWGNHKITGLKNLTAGDHPQDAANKAYVDAARTFSTGMVISGINANGRLTFSGTTGVNGLSWTTGDLFFGTNAAVANQSPNRFVFNDKVDASGTDFLAISDSGVFTTPSVLTMATNGFYVGTAWRTPIPGKVTYFQMGVGGLNLYTNVEDTDTAHDIADVYRFWNVGGGSGNGQMILNKSASGKTADFYGQMDGKSRWLIRLGNATAETTTDKVGSDFEIFSFNNAGTVPTRALGIDRSSNITTVYGDLTTEGKASADGSTAATYAFNATGYATESGNYITRLLRGNASYIEDFGIDILHVPLVSVGMRIVGGPGGNFEFRHDGQAYKTGGGSWGSISDSRVKDVQGDYEAGLAAINALRPIVYRYKSRQTEFAAPTGSDRDYVGLVAQEAEGAMPEMVTKARGYLLDGTLVDDLREMDTSPLVFALINAVKELTGRIEALEARIEDLEVT